MYILFVLIAWITYFECSTKAFLDWKLYTAPFLIAVAILLLFIFVMASTEPLPKRKDWYYDEGD